MGTSADVDYYDCWRAMDKCNKLGDSAVTSCGPHRTVETWPWATFATSPPTNHTVG